MHLLVKFSLLLALALASIATALLVTGSPSPGPGGREIVVDPSGSGDARTIAEAVEMASTGDTVRVLAGTYVEAVIVEKDIAIVGDDRDAVIVQAPPDSIFPERACLEQPAESGCAEAVWSHAFLLHQSNASLADLTIVGSGGEGVAVIAIGARAAPTLERLTFMVPSSGASVGFIGPIRGTLQNSLVTGSLMPVETGAAPSFLDNTFDGTCVKTGSGATVRGNTIVGCAQWGALGIEGTGVTVEQNRIQGGPMAKAAIEVIAADPSTTIRGNAITDSAVGVLVQGESSPTIADNDITGNRVGVRWLADSEPVVSGNRFCGNEQDLVTPAGPADAATENQVCAATASGSPTVP